MRGSLRKPAGELELAITLEPETNHEQAFCALLVDAMTKGGSITVRTSDGAAAWRPQRGAD